MLTRSFLALLLPAMLLAGRKKTSPTGSTPGSTGTGTNPGTPLAIQSISPASGGGGPGLTVTGTGFSSMVTGPGRVQSAARLAAISVTL